MRWMRGRAASCRSARLPQTCHSPWQPGPRPLAAGAERARARRPHDSRVSAAPWMAGPRRAAVACRAGRSRWR
eukprot:956010-Prymnesium_polylepis.1